VTAFVTALAATLVYSLFWLDRAARTPVQPWNAPTPPNEKGEGSAKASPGTPRRPPPAPLPPPQLRLGTAAGTGGSEDGTARAATDRPAGGARGLFVTAAGSLTLLNEEDTAAVREMVLNTPGAVRRAAAAGRTPTAGSSAPSVLQREDAGRAAGAGPAQVTFERRRSFSDPGFASQPPSPPPM